MNSRRIIILVVAVALGAFASFGIYQYTQGVRSEAYAGAELTSVWVVSEPIPKGTPAEQVVTPGEELWVKIIDIDLQRRRISLSIKQAAEGGVVAAEYQEHFGEHAFDSDGNYIGSTEVDPETEKAWAEYYEQYPEAAAEAGVEVPAAPAEAGEAAAEPAAEA